jgi:hypothetical protein
MLRTKERSKAMAAPSSSSGLFNPLDVCGRATGAEPDSSDVDQTPLAALKRAVRESFDRARCVPTDGVHFLGEPRFGQTECGSDEGRAFETFSRHVRAAQRAGELKAGDPSLMTALIVGAMVGAADLLRYARPNPQRLARDPEFPPLLLLDLLSTRACN